MGEPTTRRTGVPGVPSKPAIAGFFSPDSSDSMWQAVAAAVISMRISPTKRNYVAGRKGPPFFAIARDDQHAKNEGAGRKPSPEEPVGY